MLLRARLGVNWREHLAAFCLASLGNGILLFEESQLASRAGQQVEVVELLLVQELLMAFLTLFVAISGAVRVGRRLLYVVSSVVFAGYTGSRLASTFSATLGLVAPLGSKGIPVSDYQGSFYLLALGSAISYVLMILLLRRSYGKLLPVRTLKLA